MAGSGQRHTVLYQGRVQGVGFRATTASLATRRPVEGYVKNLANGSVELVVEGESEAVRDFLDAVAATFRDNITAADRQVAEATGEFSGFEVRY